MNGDLLMTGVREGGVYIVRARVIPGALETVADLRARGIRLVVTGAAFLPVVAGWLGLRPGVALFSVAMIGVYGAHVLLARAGLRQAGLRVRSSTGTSAIVERGDPARATA